MERVKIFSAVALLAALAFGLLAGLSEFPALRYLLVGLAVVVLLSGALGLAAYLSGPAWGTYNATRRTTAEINYLDARAEALFLESSAAPPALPQTNVSKDILDRASMRYRVARSGVGEWTARGLDADDIIISKLGIPTTSPEYGEARRMLDQVIRDLDMGGGPGATTAGDDAPHANAEID